MHRSIDFSTRELTASRIKLIDELVVAPQTNGGAVYFHLEVPSKGRFFRLGEIEYAFISLLDGKTSFAQALAQAARRHGAKALSQEKAMQVYVWLLENGLAGFTEGDISASVIEPEAARSWVSRINPFWMKLPLLRPNALLTSLQPWFGWLFSVWATVLGMLLIGVGICVVQSNWSRFADSAGLVFSPQNWLWMGGAWLLLKIIHEFAHGIVCRRHQGDVREMGVVFILFAPMAYVDVTSSWRFPSRWKRIHVAVAGMYAELVVAALAAIVWSRGGSAVVEHFLYNVILMASVSTLLFNANPLMRFDGYYILSDLLEIPNLYSEGLKRVQRWAAWLFFGESDEAPRTTGWRGWFIGAYGAAAFVTRIVICTSLLIAASLMFAGAGVVIAALGVCSWFGKPLWSLLADLRARCDTDRLSLIRAAAVAILLGGLLWGGLVAAPSPVSMASPVVVEYVDLATIRAPSAGFVASIHVADGQQVEPGQLLIQLRNKELEFELARLRSQAEQTEIRRRIAQEEHDAAQSQIEARDLQALQERIQDLASRMTNLRIVAPQQGRVLARELANLTGSYVDEGDELLALGDDNHKELIVSIPQQDIQQAALFLDQTTRFRIGAQRPLTGVLRSVEPKASLQLPHASLSATVGGPLAVEFGPQAENGPVLVEPRFQGAIKLTPETSRRLFSGQRGQATFGWRQESLGQHLWRVGAHWLRERIRNV